MARSDDYLAARKKAEALKNFLENQEGVVSNLDLDGGVVGGAIAQKIREMMERAIDEIRSVMGEVDALIAVLEARRIACEIFEAALEVYEAATRDYGPLYTCWVNNPVGNRKPSVPVRPQAPGPWAE